MSLQPCGFEGGIEVKYASKQSESITIEANSYATYTFDFSDVVGADETIINANITTTQTFSIVPMFISISQRFVYFNLRNLANSQYSTKWTCKILYVKGTMINGQA